MLVLDGVYVENDYWGLRFHRVKAPNVDELKVVVHAISHRVVRFLEKRGFIERDAESSYLALETDDDDADGATPRTFDYLPHCCGPAAGPQSFHVADVAP
jgi:hypothetical protein